MRLRQTEFRWGKTNKKFELVMWQEVGYDTDSETCHVVAFFEKRTEGFDMHTVGGRFFKSADNFFVAKHAMAYLQDLWRITQGFNIDDTPDMVEKEINQADDVMQKGDYGV